jgi:hypothetical protein
MNMQLTVSNINDIYTAHCCHTNSVQASTQLQTNVIQYDKHVNWF